MFARSQYDLFRGKPVDLFIVGFALFLQHGFSFASRTMLSSCRGRCCISSLSKWFFSSRSLQRDSVTADADKARRLLGDSRAEDVRHAICSSCISKFEGMTASIGCNIQGCTWLCLGSRRIIKAPRTSNYCNKGLFVLCCC